MLPNYTTVVPDDIPLRTRLITWTDLICLTPFSNHRYFPILTSVGRNIWEGYLMGVLRGAETFH